jgi:hypothetical protein
MKKEHPTFNIEHRTVNIQQPTIKQRGPGRARPRAQQQGQASRLRIN